MQDLLTIFCMCNNFPAELRCFVVVASVITSSNITVELWRRIRRLATHVCLGRSRRHRECAKQLKILNAITPLKPLNSSNPAQTLTPKEKQFTHTHTHPRARVHKRKRKGKAPYPKASASRTQRAQYTPSIRDMYLKL